MLAHQVPIPPWLVFQISFPLIPAFPSLQHSHFCWCIWPILILPCPQPAPSCQAGPIQGSSRWQERTSCLTCSPQGLSRNGCAWYLEGNCCLATGPPLSSAFLADMQEQTTQPPKSGGLTGGGLDPIDQNQRQQHSALAKEFSAKMIKYCTSHPEHVPTEFLVLSVSVRWETKTHF